MKDCKDNDEDDTFRKSGTKLIIRGKKPPPFSINDDSNDHED